MKSYFDASALVKHYHRESGTDKVDRLLVQSGAQNVVSRLGIIEVQSMLAAQLRAGSITESGFQMLRRRLSTDAATGRLVAVRVTERLCREAEYLIRRHAVSLNLRTLDALHLATALDLHRRSPIDRFICADQILIAAAQAEGFSVVNPLD